MTPACRWALEALAELAEPFEDDGEDEGACCQAWACDHPVTGGYVLRAPALAQLGYPAHVDELRLHLCDQDRCLVVLGSLLGDEDVDDHCRKWITDRTMIADH